MKDREEMQVSKYLQCFMMKEMHSAHLFGHQETQSILLRNSNCRQSLHEGPGFDVIVILMCAYTGGSGENRRSRATRGTGADGKE